MKPAHWFFVLCVLAVARPQLFGQEQGKLIVVSPLIGDTLDAAERGKFQLFPNVKGFEWAVFYLGPDSSLVVKASLLEDGVRRDTIIARYRTLKAVQNQVHQLVEGSLQEENRRLQDTSRSERLQRITLRDGSEIIGRVEFKDSGSIRFKTLSNITMTIPKREVKEVELLSGEVVGGGYRRADPNQTRLLFAPNARSLKAGQGYFSAYEIFFPFVAVGVTDFVALAGGMTLFPGASDQLFYLAPKIRAIHVQNLDLAGGMLYLNSTSGSGETRVSNSVKLITENWIPPNSHVSLLSFGIRFFGDNLAADLGFIYPAGSDISGFPFLPWLGFAYNFGGSK
jgi:hypothetical protein